MAREAAVQMLLDREELHDLQMRYAKAVDERDWPLLRTVWAEEGLLAKYGQNPFTDIDSVIKYISGVARNHTTYHFMGNQFIDVTGDTGTLWTFSMLTHHETRDNYERELNVVRARYLDKVRRTARGWRVQERGEVPNWQHTGVTKTVTKEPAVQLLLDRAELHDLMMHYALGLDLREWPRVTGCFAPGFVARYGEREFRDAEGLTNFVRAIERYDLTLHFMGQQLVEISGDEARMETYAMVTHEHNDPLTGFAHRWTTSGGRYIDKVKRHNGHWLIAERGGETPRVRTGMTYPTSSDPDVQHLLDRAAIEDVIARFTFALDRRDYELLGGCFAPSFAYVHGEQRFTTTAALVGHLKSLVEHFASTSHFLGNQLISVSGGEATAETYCYVTHRDSQFSTPSEWSKGGRKYLDRLVKRDGPWLIAERVVGNNRMPEHKITKPPVENQHYPTRATSR